MKHTKENNVEGEKGIEILAANSFNNSKLNDKMEI